jgi:hypothetical protein
MVIVVMDPFDTSVFRVVRIRVYVVWGPSGPAPRREGTPEMRQI